MFFVFKRYFGEEYGVSNINQYPILNQREAQKELELPFDKYCGDDNLCSSELRAELNIKVCSLTQFSQLLTQL